MLNMHVTSYKFNFIEDQIDFKSKGAYNINCEFLEKVYYKVLHETCSIKTIPF